MKKLILLALACGAASARADEAKPVRVGASHKVDVIGPGERVETAIDRMRRTSSPVRDIAPRPPDRLAPRAPTERTSTERPAAAEGQQKQQGGPPPAAPAQTGNPGPPHR